jgi:hypothetical protein
MVMKFCYCKLAGNSRYRKARLQMKTKAREVYFLPGAFNWVSQQYMLPYFLLCASNMCTGSIINIYKIYINYSDLRCSRLWLWRMPSSEMLRHVAIVRTDVSEERIAPIIRVTRIGELGTTLAVTSNIYTGSILIRSVLPLLVIANIPSSPIFWPW